MFAQTDNAMIALCSSRIIGTVAAIVVYLAAGCATTNRTTGLQAARAGMDATESAIKACEALGDLKPDNAYYQGYLRIVVSPTPDRVDFTAVSEADFSQQIENRIASLRHLHAAYDLFGQLCEGKTAKDASQSYAALVETLKGLSHDAAASAATKAAASQLPGDLAALWQAKRIARAERILGRLSADMAALWERDRIAWDDAIDAVYIRHYASGILSLGLENFDEKELGKAVGAPYHPPVKAGLYKLGLYREAQQKAARLKAKLSEVSDAFRQTLLLYGQPEEASIIRASEHETIAEGSPGTTRHAHPHTQE